MPASLVALLLRSVKDHPERPAVGLPGEEPLTYSGLDRASAGVAAWLTERGVRRGDRVGILLPKSVEAVAGVWGILRTGAAYVPIDRSSPPQRAALIAANCGMSALLTSTEAPGAVEAIRATLPGIPVLLLHGVGGTGVPSPSAGPLPSPNVRDLAYILYTSGSTGVPKGVMVSHGAALSFVEWAATRFDLRPEDVLSSHAPLHFDLSTFDLFGAALAGARLVVLDEETVRFPMASAEVLETERISVWYSVPGALRRMVRTARLSDRKLPALRTVLFAGEVYPADELRALQLALPPDTALYNLYGPTETNVCTWWQVPPAGTWTSTSVPIGVDCENCEGVVVDPELKPVPVGEAGELLVRGGTLMEGYWGDAEATARSFVADFLHPHLPDRLYRTGDIVRRQEDGTYAFHGRVDHMVKVRGYRVELGEVESALLRASGVTEAAVVAVERDGSGGRETELVAFVSGEGPDPGRERDLRRHLASHVLKYMVPAEIRFLGEFPTTSSGKIDRQALKALASQPETASSGAPARRTASGKSPGETT